MKQISFFLRTHSIRLSWFLPFHWIRFSSCAEHVWAVGPREENPITLWWFALSLIQCIWSTCNPWQPGKLIYFFINIHFPDVSCWSSPSCDLYTYNTCHNFWLPLEFLIGFSFSDDICFAIAELSADRFRNKDSNAWIGGPARPFGKRLLGSVVDIRHGTQR